MGGAVHRSPPSGTAMDPNVFDQVARDYVRIHDRSLPPGVHSADFIRQRAAAVSRWIAGGTTGSEFCFLDFGCGNGRMLKLLLESSELKPLAENGRLRLFGHDTSVESIQEAKSLAGDAPVRLVNDWRELPPDVRFDFVVSCHVFHHIPPASRASTAKTLRNWMKPRSRLVIWEHNPFNPLTRLLVKMCPFDGDARLLTLTATRRLFRDNAFHPVQHAYVNVCPPRWLRFAAWAALEKQLCGLPVGAQYWAMFERNG
jgi:SAM-dependent methyltransferase